MQHVAEIGSLPATEGSQVSIRYANPLLASKGGRPMPAAKAPPIQLSPDQERERKALARAHSTPQKLAERARIILLASNGRGVTETAEELVSGARRRGTGAAAGSRRSHPRAWPYG